MERLASTLLVIAGLGLMLYGIPGPRLGVYGGGIVSLLGGVAMALVADRRDKSEERRRTHRSPNHPH